MIGYGRQFVDDDDVASVVQALRGDFLTQGDVVPRFEAALAERVGAKFAVAVSNGTAALHVACLAAGLDASGSGMTSAITFVASANCMKYCGARVSVIDIDADDLGMSTEALKRHLGQKSEDRVVVPVHMAGLSCRMRELRTVAGDRIVIEDASHALGGSDEAGRPVGSCAHSDMTTFSFHPVKPITTGEGGAITTNDPELHRRLLLLRSHGIERSPERIIDQQMQGAPWYYEQQLLGYNYRLTDIQAALGLSQLAKLDRFIARRREIASRYDAEFSRLTHLRPLQSAGRHRSGIHLYVVAIDFAAIGKDRASVMRELRNKGIGTQVHYIPVHHHPSHAGSAPHECPAADSYYERCLSLPIHVAMSDEDVEVVIDAVREAVTKSE